MQIRDLEKKAIVWNRCKKIWKIVNPVQLSIHIHTFPKAAYPIQSLSQADSSTKLDSGVGCIDLLLGYMQNMGRMIWSSAVAESKNSEQMIPISY